MSWEEKKSGETQARRISSCFHVVSVFLFPFCAIHTSFTSTRDASAPKLQGEKKGASRVPLFGRKLKKTLKKDQPAAGHRQHVALLLVWEGADKGDSKFKGQRLFRVNLTVSVPQRVLSTTEPEQRETEPGTAGRPHAAGTAG